MGFEVIKRMNMMNAILWDMKPRIFERKYHFLKESAVSISRIEEQIRYHGNVSY
jgi:hypothetical protein